MITIRLPASAITDDVLTALYDRLDETEDAIRRLSSRLHARTISDDPELASQAAALLLRDAPDSEVSRLVRAAIRSGWMWRCPDCRAPYYANQESCGCGGIRPTDAEETDRG